jgi:hypothetical protein
MNGARHQPTDDLRRALDALTVQAVWRHAGLPDCPREGNHLVKSPFREDRKKSFSICYRGHGWKDHATGESGGVWQFAQRALAKEGKELADALIDLSGVPRTPRRRTEDGGQRAEAGAEEFKARRRMRPKPYAAREVKARMETEHARALASRVEVRDVPVWSETVQARWPGEGRTSAHLAREIEALAAARGWPVAWIEELLAMDLIAWPLLPWCDTRRGREDERGVAFPVELPVFRVDGREELRRVGYHQRFVIRGEKSWVYCPYLKPKEDCRSAYQRAMREEALARGMREDGPALVPGLPFVLAGGYPVTDLIITEGQWDALSFAGACGWLENDAWPLGWWVMGARGNNGADTLLAYWGPWLRRWKPRVRLLADNDVASLAWDHARMAGEGKPGEFVPWCGAWEPGVMPSFKEKLQALGCAVAVRRVSRDVLMADGKPAKDFNDYWKARRPSAGAMARWLASAKFDTPTKSL